MTTTFSLPTCWIIDHNPGAADSLKQLLQKEGYGQVLGTSTWVADWPGEPVDCLFIRISAWDDYLRWRWTHRQSAAETVVFLSGRFEKGSRHLGEDRDFHLRPPYQPGRLAGIMRRRTDPDFPRRSLDLFFLNIRYRFQVVYFRDLWYIEGNGGGTIHIHTARGKYTVSGTLGAFQRRLPISWQRVDRSVVAAQYEPGSFEKSGRLFG
jgi:hypothetical protein